MRLLLSQKADPNAVDSEGSTPLHFAALKGHVEPTRLLLQSGAASDRRDNSGRTPLLNACYGGHIRVVELLLHTDAQVLLSPHPLSQHLGLPTFLFTSLVHKTTKVALVSVGLLSAVT